MKFNKKIEFLKPICWSLVIIFMISCSSGVIISVLGFDTTVFMYIIPASATMTTVVLSFYCYKARAENLSKQRIRFVLMKLLLEDKLPPDTYSEIVNEIENIDSVLSNKLTSMTDESVDIQDEMNNVNFM